jgi:uncharacterized protein
MTKLIVFGAAGRLGQMVLDEARERKLAVTASVRAPDRQSDLARDGVAVVRADATDADAVTAARLGHDAAIASLYQDQVPHDAFYAASAAALLEGLAHAGVGRLVVVGGTPTLETEPGVRLMDGAEFPAAYLPFAYGHAAGLHVLRAARASTVDWLVLTPPSALDLDGPRTGSYRLGQDGVMSGDDGPSGLSYADLSIALVDEAHNLTRHNTRSAIAH